MSLLYNVSTFGRWNSTILKSVSFIRQTPEHLRGEYTQEIEKCDKEIVLFSRSI